jgi:hypothetical protein
MRPAFIDDMSWEMAEVYGAITDQILINLARHFPYFKPENLPGSAFAYQADMLAQMGQVNRETVRIIRNGLKNADDALQGCLEQAIIDSIKSVNPALYKAAKAGILKMPTSIVTAPNQMRAFQLYYQQAAQKLNMVNTVMLESTKQAYQATVAGIVNRVQATQTALDIGAGEVVTGVSSWNQAMVHSINRMKANGITGFIDHGGHRWSAEAYTAMDIRTTMANTARAAVWETNQDFGNDLYSVSYHDGARPLCYPWQNKVISSLDRSGVTYDLDGNEIQIYPQSSTSYGEPAGLFGINCKHYPTPFIPGVSLIRGQPMSEEANAQAYEDSQKQRALERKIREEKRDLMMLKAQGAPDEVIKAQRAKIRQTDDDIDNFCAETGRARRQNREGVYTERKFPSADTYDVTQFERTQKDLLDKFFEDGGAQQGYTFGELSQNETQRTLSTTNDLGQKPQRPHKEDFDTYEDYDIAYEKYKTEREEWKAKREELINNWVEQDRAINTHDEFLQFADKMGIRVDEDFIRNVDPKVLDDLAKVDEEMISRFPEVKARQDKMYQFGHSYERTRDYLMEGSRGINFGESFVDIRDAYGQVINGQLDGTFVKGDGTIKTLIRHEYGHNVDSYIRDKFSTIDADYSWKVSGKTERRFAALRQYEKEVMELATRYGSDYSHTNELEAFAEGFAEYTSNPNSEFGKAFGEFFERWYYASPIE